jgi:hypothetical protein
MQMQRTSGAGFIVLIAVVWSVVTAGSAVGAVAPQSAVTFAPKPDRADAG